MKKSLIGILVVALFGSGYYFLTFGLTNNKAKTPVKPTTSSANLKKAYFGGGCFWCMEGIFEAQKGVTESISGYA